MKTFELGVGDLVSFTIRSGSIDRRGNTKSRALLGTKIHQMIQEKDSKIKEDYKSEVYFKFDYKYKDYNFILTGRVDAIYKENGKPVIEEIKSTQKANNKDFAYSETHLAQLIFYGLFYCLENNLNEIDLVLHYYHISTEEDNLIEFHLTLDELKKYVNDILNKWLEIGILRSELIDIRNDSINDLNFIYDSYRSGQREMSLAIFNTIKRDAKVLIEAPTGIGKTIASLFPSIKSLINKENYQIYYLTSKTTIQNEANKALERMRKAGLQLKSTTITAKEKVCFLKKAGKVVNCNPEDCKYAKDYFNKINTIIKESIKSHSNFDRDYILKISEEYEVCPYQLSLDLSNWSDVIICDYNYAFDPISSLENFNKNRICLIDEAHNLPDRSREMFSASINIQSFKELYFALTSEEAIKQKENKKLAKKTKSFISYLEEVKESLQSSNKEIIPLDISTIKEIEKDLLNFQLACTLYLGKVNDEKVFPDEDILEYFNQCSSELYRFFVILELIESNKKNYSNYMKIDRDDITIRLACLDASKFLSETLETNPTILFSATMTPFDYYQNVLLGEEIPNIAIPSPFKKENYKVLCNNTISTRYSDRELSYNNLIEIIYKFINSRKGNYIVFFPSYSYLNTIYDLFVENYNIDDLTILKQVPNMSEKQREEFINTFKNKELKSTLGFFVMGGIFSEGIDLPQDELIGTIIVGPGLPGIDYERDLIKDYFQEENGNGYAYAYAYPGMNRVLQSAGRVIRTENDHGVILFIDDRFAKTFYNNMIPNHLKPEYLSDISSLEYSLNKFWNKF